jgi:hypothetical protein
MSVKRAVQQQSVARLLVFRNDGKGGPIGARCVGRLTLRGY